MMASSLFLRLQRRSFVVLGVLFLLKIMNESSSLFQATSSITGSTSTKTASKTPAMETILTEMLNMDDEQDKMNYNLTRFCLPWTSDFDIDEWWTHRYDWDEDRIATNITHQCFQRIDDPARLEFLRKVHQVQWHGNCSLLQQSYMINSGYGASFSVILKAFYSTMVSGKFQKPYQMTKHWHGAVWLFATRDNSSWAYCPQRSMGCFLLPLSNCPPKDYRADPIPRPGAVGRDPRYAYLRQYMNRYKKIVRHRIIETLHNDYPSVPLPCTTMHVRRGDAGLPRAPYRRYAAVSEYLQTGNVQAGENIVLLTDDETTIQEVQKYHAQEYNWIFANRPRNQAAHGGFDGHLPSGDPATDLLAILCEIRMASQCTKLVHGYSGFVTLITQAMDEMGTNYTSYYLNTAISKAEAATMGGGAARGDNMIKLIEEKMQNETQAKKSQNNTVHLISEGGGGDGNNVTVV